LVFGKVAVAAASGAQVVPVVLQAADSGDVLFIGYANEADSEASVRERIVVLWFTSRNELWRKERHVRGRAGTRRDSGEQ
jgi:phosphoribosyl-AMP cyclohydrolase